MALTLTAKSQYTSGDRKVTYVTAALDNSYPTGGYSLTAANLGGKNVYWVQAATTSGYVFQFDYSGKKLLAYYGDNNNASDGPLIEVPNGTDLSLITGVRIRAEVK